MKEERRDGIMKRNILNIMMVIMFLLLMNYRFTHNFLHEIIGAIILLLALWHNKLNISWYKTFFNGKQNIRRIMVAIINILFVLSFVVVMISGLLISRSLIPSLAVHGSSTILWHQIHQVSAYICFITIGIHLGFHWKMLWIRLQHWLGIEKFYKKYAIIGTALVAGIIAYGVYASFTNHVGAKLLMEHSFRGGQRPSAMQFFMDYTLIIASYIGITHYLTKLLAKNSR